ncbi:MAG: tRNA uridine-5-carboxymethylaminomethyl(34) synthesis enzyme MnmG [FCB group bacterium]|nr:tRNA uridine-5-carboxymethylaminomethyl(34) synthesis enzyme MnmG [FCB group bacterium]
MKHEEFDILVVGGGHAGVEAASIAAYLGRKTALITMDLRSIARMSCNPAIGGLAKGQIVREIDVLGGIMGRFADWAGIQFKILNRSKGRSVWSPRAQVDKRLYEQGVQRHLSRLKNLTLIAAEVVNFIDARGQIEGVILSDQTRIASRNVILTCGTFLNGLIHIGRQKIRAGRMGESAANGITEALHARGFSTGRLKTGTPPRLDAATIDWSLTKPVRGDDNPVPFSYRSHNFDPPNVLCHQVYTSESVHEIIREKLIESPLYSGDIHGTGPRYCPSIEDKVYRFAHHSKHLIFLEPEWTGSRQIYANGFSTSLPEDVQLEALRKIPALKNVEFLRPGYAIEYDFIPPRQHKNTLESKALAGLFFAGQVNGTSGYEEAAAQGLVAGINAAARSAGTEPLILGRNEAYIGVLIDDLITKDTVEPYRMFTSRAEFRLLLRFSNADARLLSHAKRIHLLPQKEILFLETKQNLTRAVDACLNTSLSPDEMNPVFVRSGTKQLTQKQPARALLKRPEIRISDLPIVFPDFPADWGSWLKNEILSEAETEVKYEGYIQRQWEQVQKSRRHEKISLPAHLDYSGLLGLSNEAREKLSAIRPQTLGQAMRIQGISPADIAVLSVYLVRK